MAWTYYIYSPLSPLEARRLEDQYSKDFDRFLELHQDIANSEEGTGMVFVGADVPTPDEVRAVSSEFGLGVSASMSERLTECRSTIEIENPFPPESSRLQVSTLRYLLEKAGRSIMDWGDYQLQTSERAIAKLGQLESFGEIGPAKRIKPERPKRKKESAGEKRALRIVELFHLAEESQELAIDLQRMISRQPELSQKYLAFLFSHGAVDDAEAAQALGVDMSALAPLLVELEGKFDLLTD